MGHQGVISFYFFSFRDQHIVLVDLFTPMVETPNFEKKLTKDRLHPNEAGCEVEADVWFEALKSTFR